MKTIFTFTLACIAIGMGTINAQNFGWARSIGGVNDDRAYSISADANGNIYTTGHFEGTVDFDPGPETVNLTSVGNKDIFIMKLTPAGHFLWAKAIGGTNNDRGFSMAIDDVGNAFITGTFMGTADFDPGIGTTNLTSVGNDDVYVLKMDTDGNFLWAKSFGGTANDLPRAISTDTFGNVYVTGNFRSNVDFDPGVETTNLTSLGTDDIFIQKLDTDGNFIWAKSFGGPQNDQVRSIAIDAAGNVYTTGEFSGTVDFDPGVGTANLTVSGTHDVFAQKLDTNGNFIWAKRLPLRLGNSICVDALGNVYIAGQIYDGNVCASNEVNVRKMDTNGNLLWTKSFGAGGDEGLYIQGFSLKVDAFGNVYTMGWVDSNTYFDPIGFYGALGSYYLPNCGSGEMDTFLQKLDPSGYFVWALRYGGSSYCYGQSITLDAIGNIYTIGLFQGYGDFDPSFDPGITYLNSEGSYDIFIQKINQCVETEGEDIQAACGSYTWIDGKTYNSSNYTAKYNLINATGCDSTVTLKLTIGNGSMGVDTRTACNSYTWIDGNTYTASNNTATYTTINALGCDSIVTLNLTITNPTIAIDTQSACNSYTWIDGITYTASNNTATYVLNNTAGCDSIVTLNLTVNSISNIGTTLIGAVISANKSNATYQWINCDNNQRIEGATNQTFTATESGNYAVEVTENGCSNISECVEVAIVGIDELSNDLLVTVYPNPTQGTVEINLGSTIQDVELVLTDIQGKVIYARNYPSLFRTNIELPNEKGVYLLKLKAQENTRTVRLVKD